MRILGGEGTVKVLMGNEAIARGAIEGGVGLVTGYPGTPSTEVIETLISSSEETGVKVNWSVNEKVAAEEAAAAAFAGVNAMTTMKSAGLNVASDSIIQIAYSGVEGGLLIYVADDPGSHAGMAEQDSRLFAKLSTLPMLEPADPQEVKDMTVNALEMSERLKIPVFLRGTTATAHMSGDVKFGPKKSRPKAPSFTRDIKRYTKANPQWCMNQHASLIKKLEEFGELAIQFDTNRLEEVGEQGDVGIIVSGSAYNYLREAIHQYGLQDFTILKIGAVNPLPDDLIEKIVSKVDVILILEELEPFIENHVFEILGRLGGRVKVHGKHDGTTPRVGDFNQAIVDKAIRKVFSIGPPASPSARREELIEEAKESVIPRSLAFCPGCPHRGTYMALLKAMKKLGYERDDVIVTGDIGCTILGMNPPFNVCWTEVCMGASTGIANGFREAGIRKPIIATIGDSTFYHAGIPPLIDTAWKGINITIAVLDNETVAMTGHQPTPGSEYSEGGEGTTKPVRIEDIARGCGIKHVEVVDPYDLQKSTEAFVNALKRDEPSVVVLRRLCAILARRRKLIEEPLKVDQEKCTGCMECIQTTGCAALHPTNGKMEIDPDTCIGCGLCAEVCPTNAIAHKGRVYE